MTSYSRRMEEDEAGTLARLKLLRRELIDAKIVKHKGRLVKTTGDGLLIEFASVVDAVRCAVEVQLGMAQHNAEISEGKGIEFRIGINLGDVIVDGEDIYGDGFNTAARLEALSERLGRAGRHPRLRQGAHRCRRQDRCRRLYRHGRAAAQEHLQTAAVFQAQLGEKWRLVRCDTAYAMAKIFLRV